MEGDKEMLDEILAPDGRQLLNDVKDWIGRFVCTVADADLDLLTVWAVHTHLIGEVYTTPRLVIDSPMPGSGKTTCLEHLQRITLRPVQMATLSSPALLARMLDTEMRTLLIDEADRSLSPDKDGIADLMAVLNSGYKRGATRPVLVPVKGGDWTVKEMPTYAPVAMAGNNPNLPEDTRSRTIRVLLLPDLDNRAEESDWELIETAADHLAQRIAAWAETVREDIKTARPPLPEGVSGRFREKWSPLRRVAEVAGGRWPDAVDAMALQDLEQYAMDKEDGLVRERPHMLLLRHLAEVWPGGEKFVPTSDLIDSLIEHHPDAWGDANPIGKALTAHRLGRMMATNFKVNSARPDTNGPRGYLLAGLLGPMSRLGIHPPSRPDEVAQPAEPDESSSARATPATSSGLKGTPSVNRISGPTPLQLELAADPDRCADCGLHTELQGHRAGCPRREAS